LGNDGQFVVKDPRAGTFYNLGEQEAFLLLQLDGMRTAEAICTAFEEQFGQPLSGEDLQEFLELARTWGFLRSSDGSGTAVVGAPDPTPRDDSQVSLRRSPAPDGPLPPRPRRRPNLLAWRIKLFDPSRLFCWLEPKLQFVWTGPFFILSAGCILAAAALAWANRQELASQFPHAMGRETLALAWLTLLAVTLCHEFAHGLTCKHYGGEVHEVGFLMLFLMPCLYCNVSDAWLFREKSKRLWVTLAGCYCELVMWALAVFIWRFTLQDSRLNYLAWMVVSVCGIRVLFNFNPLMKLDGYYLLSDLVDIPNLRQRALGAMMAHLRRLLWGAQRPRREPRGQFLASYGIATWLFSLGFLALMLGTSVWRLEPSWRLVGLGVATLLGALMLRGLFQGLFAGEVTKMIRMRRRRTAMWLLIGGALPTVLTLGQMEHVAKGPFHVRPLTRAELRAPVAGFLQAVYLDQGDRVSPGVVIARLEVPDLDSRVAQKDAEVREARAKLRQAESGTRREEMAAQRRRVDRAKVWRDLAQQDLTRVQQALHEELARLDAQIAQHRAEYDAAADAHNRAKKLLGRGVVSAEEYWEADRRWRVCWAQLQQAEAQRRARRADGTREAEAELARRDQALAEAEAALVLLEAGTRPEEIDAARARLARLEEEASYLEGLREKLLVYSPVPGLITTPRLREKIGQFVREGELICEVKASSVLEAEISLAEQDVARVRPGQQVELKARALPFRTFHVRVDRIAPGAVAGEGQQAQSTVTVYCRLEEPAVNLRPAMTGYARIACGQRPIGEILAERAQGVLRTEFWW
jgi:multidrug resistance efflux pump